MSTRSLGKVNGETKLLGILGHNISHTQSPTLHNRAAAQLGENCVYVPFDMPGESVEAFLSCFWKMGGIGLNVTTPHKELVAGLIDECDLPSVNTLYRGDKGWQAASTDGEGFALGLQRINRTLNDFDELVVLGNGGAALAILVHICGHSQAYGKVTVLRRSNTKDASWKLRLGGKLPLTFVDFNHAELEQAIAGKGTQTLLLQATNAPLRGEKLDDLTPALKDFKGVVADLVYGKPSALYFNALALNLVAIDGEAMLIEQARLSQKLWWRKAAAFQEMAAALRGK